MKINSDNNDSSSLATDTLASRVETMDLQRNQLESLLTEHAKATTERDSLKTDVQSLRQQLANVSAERDLLQSENQSLRRELDAQLLANHETNRLRAPTEKASPSPKNLQPGPGPIQYAMFQTAPATVKKAKVQTTHIPRLGDTNRVVKHRRI